MLYRSFLGLLIIPTLAPFLWGQEYFPITGQPMASEAAYATPMMSNSLTAPGQYTPSITPYTPVFPPAPSQASASSSGVGASAPYASQYSTAYQSTPPQYSLPAVPQAAPYAVPNTAPFTLPPYQPQPTPYIAVPTQSMAPQATQQASPTTQSTQEPTTAKPDAAEPASHEEPVAEADEVPLLVEETAPAAWYYTPIYWFDLWEGNVELGMSGSNGNTETLNYLIGLDAKRETEKHIFDFDLKYDRKSADDVETAHRLFAEVRWEMLFEDAAWTWFYHETTEYDEFTAYDVRLSYDTGLGRRLIKNDDTSFLARAGAGFSHEIGSPNEELVPEAVLGLEFDHKLNERQKFSASSEYSPDVTDFLDYRLKSKASWEVLLDEETNLSLKVSLLDRYDSTPNGKKANDLDYTLTLLWSF